MLEYALFQALGLHNEVFPFFLRSLLLGDTGNIIRSGNSALSKSNGGERDKNVFLDSVIPVRVLRLGRKWERMV